MHICILEHPRIPSSERFNDIANTPLWSCLMGGYAAAALLRDGHRVTFMDAATGGLDFHATRMRLTALAPDLLAINAIYFWEHTHRLLESITALKGERPSMRITLFGFFPSLAYAQILALCPAVDSVCVGECEHTLRELVAAIDAKLDWQSVPGLAFAKDDQICFPAARRPDPGPDKFAFPLRAESKTVAEKDTAAVLASRGCYNHCSFCPIPVFYNRRALWRGRSPGNILLEIEQLMARGYRRFYFVDPNFVGPGKSGRRRTLDLMEGLKPFKIRFGMETRPNDLNEEILAAMTEAGLESLLLGIESGSPQVLDTLSKHATADLSSRAIALCRQAGIEPEVGFLMHTPDASVGDLFHNLAFLAKNGLLDRLERTANLLCHRQIVFRGTLGFERYREQGRILGTDPLGFEARIAWQDPRAEWVAEVIVPVCLDILRLTGDPASPLYWKTAAANRWILDQVNDRLVNAFQETLCQAARAVTLPEVESARQCARAGLLASH
ncbi:MAG: radical SAM protein [Deltaproteobacteria bacterium]|nr:radical SAM protein [Deltaproteobacteria bacterium]